MPILPRLLRAVLPEAGPQRVIALSSFVNMLGSGMFMVSSALFATRVVGLSVAQVAVALGIAAIIGMTAGIPVGHLADRRGPREVYLVTLCVQATAMAALVAARSFAVFLVALCVGELARIASVSARAPLVRRFGDAELPRFRAYLRSVANLAGALGAVAAGFAVQLDTRTAYVAVVVGNAASFVVSAAITVRLPSVAPVEAPPAARRWLALRDRGYLAFTVLDAIMSIQGRVLVFGLPLWIVGHTSAPRWLVGAAMLLNTVLVVVFQVRAGRNVDGSAPGGRAFRRAGLAFLAGMALMAAATGQPGWVAAVLVVAGVAVHTIGELWQAAGSMELRFSLVPAYAQGQYTGVASLGSGLVNVVAPTVVAVLCLTWGAPGWLLLGGVFVLVGLSMPAVVRWTERHSPVYA
ncbi:multisubunit Na+/H+ antiporter MnhC subunit [Hamadaea flava]|uniref:MFS transporter n=1 Tax=Hamadaea flava TaxID=1742688 RepID=A0ABV8LMP5_9ACTN|nr:MFS transporter [Hamadaea flava]MCP2324000.1 multisubunit Na+/H+ antiporter MnhC subunit [Hamadaea flava]